MHFTFNNKLDLYDPTQVDDAHDHDFTTEQLESLLRSINSTYRAGPDGLVDPPEDVCWSGNVTVSTPTTCRDATLPVFPRIPGFLGFVSGL